MNPSALQTQYAPDTPLSEIPWEELPPALQETCWQFLQSWWDALDLDQPIEASGLADMTLAQVAALQESEEEQRASKCYRLIPFMRIEPEGDGPLTYEQALSEKQQQELLCPENIYRIEEIPHP